MANKKRYVLRGNMNDDVHYIKLKYKNMNGKVFYTEVHKLWFEHRTIESYHQCDYLKGKYLLTRKACTTYSIRLDGWTRGPIWDRFKCQKSNVDLEYISEASAHEFVFLNKL